MPIINVYFDDDTTALAFVKSLTETGDYTYRIELDDEPTVDDLNELLSQALTRYAANIRVDQTEQVTP
jgi:hypothetical protein